jgi:hypothetical protein
VGFLVRREGAKRGQKGDADRWQPSQVAGDLTKASSFNSGGEGTAPWEWGSAGDREWGGSKWTMEEDSREDLRLINRNNELGLGCTSASAIGCCGRCIRAAL